MTDTGDLEFSGNDLDLVGSEKLVIQVIRNVLRTGDDWLTYPDISPELMMNIGEVNTKKSGEKLASLVEVKLEALKIVQPGQIRVRAVPTGIDTLLLRIQLPTTSVGVSIDITSSSVDIVTTNQESARAPVNPRVSRSTNPFLLRNSRL